MKTLVGFLFALLVTTPALAGVQAFSGNSNLGLFNQVKCSTGLTCTRSGLKLNMVSSPTLSGSQTVLANEGSDAYVLLQADESDDNGDDWKIQVNASGNALDFLSDTSGSYVSKLAMSTGGILTMANSDTLSNATDDSLIFASEDEASVIQVLGFEAKDASLQLYADQGDDNADKFGLKYSTSGLLTFEVNGTAEMTMSSTGELYGYVQKQTAATTTSLTAAQCGQSIVGDSADVLTLPEASTVLGCRYTIISGTADDLDVNPADGTDQIAHITASGGTITPSGGDAIRLTDIGSSVTLEAIGANLWAVVAHNGAITDVN